MGNLLVVLFLYPSPKTYINSRYINPNPKPYINIRYMNIGISLVILHQFLSRKPQPAAGGCAESNPWDGEEGQGGGQFPNLGSHFGTFKGGYRGYIGVYRV